MKSHQHEPLAIVGIGCRFPGGVDSSASLWKLLVEGKSAIGPVPLDRWDASSIYDERRESPGKTWACEGGFLEHIDRFDAHFFGLSPREAAALDPQTRLVMEVAYEAFEDAGQDPSRRSQTTGVYVGVSGSDYQDIQLSDRRAIDGYVATGTALSGASNRVSHALDLHGPSMSVDTACSSSLVAVHLAAQSLWTGESDLALAGGVGLLICPEMTIAFSKGFMLAPDRRCKAFDSRANGFVRGEGAGMVVLKRLSDALAEGDRIYAVLLATAVNQDGFTPQGIAVPNQRVQEAQLETAYRRAGVRPEEVRYVEAHGPGTPVGDPIEAGALGAVLGGGRKSGDELVIGSIKTNIGHLEPAAGIAGLIKAVLALHEGAIPPNLHFERPNHAIPLQELGLRVPTRLEPWTPNGKRRVAGVNSFGFGGTNAHVVLAGAELHAAGGRHEPMRAGAPWVLPLSARSREALGELVAA
ncbi:MAG TPA: polyketide synthase, partial [Archangium sp.]|nr:polyketide synthase [Archangium sp.]